MLNFTIIYITKKIFYGHTKENLHNCIDSSAVTLPHASKPWLSSNVPHLKRYEHSSLKTLFKYTALIQQNKLTLTCSMQVALPIPKFY